jgi:formylglycine-generating enzyme required for sulfatase activity
VILPAGQTTVVGAYLANAFGLHDMLGNVGEWCYDTWDISANYPSTPQVDPVVTSGFLRVVRGGNWNSPSVTCASPTRGAFHPNAAIFTSSQFGFRVVLAPIIP